MNESWRRALQQSQAQLADCSGQIYVGLSGGLDSVVLLHYLTFNTKHSVTAIHVNHQLQTDAGDWQLFCQKLCLDWQVPLIVEVVSVDREGNLEAAARQARYGAFKQHLQADDLLLLAHHQNDQIETMLLSLFRGDAATGLKGMPVSRQEGAGQLLRPLLTLTRKQIEDYGQQNTLDWVEDHSNQDMSFDRNFLRHELMPSIEARWPNVQRRMLGALDKAEVQQQLVTELARTDLDVCLSSPQVLCLATLARYSVIRQKNLMRHWLGKYEALQPREVFYDNLVQNMMDAASSASPKVEWQDWQLCRFANHLYLLPKWLDTEAFESLELTPDQLAASDLYIGLGHGELYIEQQHNGLKLPRNATVSVKRRVGGEKLLVDKHRSLKNLMQENQVPEFLRSRLPLIFVQDELVATAAVPEFGVEMIIAKPYAAKARLLNTDETSVVSFSWRLNR